jgi:assimilatory nitrate reductase catalytic subunit
VHLAVAPDGDAALFAGLLAYLDHTGHLDDDYLDRHTNGFEAAVAAAAALSMEEIVRQTGLSPVEIIEF